MLTKEAEDILVRLFEAEGACLLLIRTDGGTFVNIGGTTVAGDDDHIDERRRYVDAVGGLSDTGLLRHIGEAAFELTGLGATVGESLIAEKDAENAAPDTCILHVAGRKYEVTYMGVNANVPAPPAEYNMMAIGVHIGPGLYHGCAGFFGIHDGQTESVVAVLCDPGLVHCLQNRGMVPAREMNRFFKRPGLRAVREYLLGTSEANANGKLSYPLSFDPRVRVDDLETIAEYVDAVDDPRPTILVDCERDILTLLYNAREERRPDGVTAAEIVAWSRKRRFYAAREHVHWTLEDLLKKELIQADNGMYFEVNIRRMKDIRRIMAGLPSDKLFDEQPAAQQAAYVPESTGEFDAFLCHASEDKLAIVDPFTKAMEKAGMKPWVDNTQVKWGDNLVKKIQEGLTRSSYVVVFISESFLNKDWPDTELNTALSMEIGNRPLVLPILLGLTHDELQARYPIVSAKLYKAIPEYTPSVVVTNDVIGGLIEKLRERLKNE